MTAGRFERFDLRPVAPFRLDLTAWTLRRRSHNAVDRFDGGRYARVLDIGGEPVAVSVTQVAPPDVPRLSVELTASRRLPPHARSAAAAALRRLLGLDVELAPFYELAGTDERLDELAIRFVGMRPPRFASVFEALVNAICCQQLSLTVGIELLNRLAKRFGRFDPRCSGQHGFPVPEHLAAAPVPELRSLGFSSAKARALVGLAELVASGALDLEELSSSVDDVYARLVALSGIGRWSAQYALLRGYGHLDVLPGDDVGARRNLERRFGLRRDAGYEDVAALTARWFPYAGLVYFHLLLDSLAEAGVFDGSVPIDPSSSARSPDAPRARGGHRPRPSSPRVGTSVPRSDVVTPSDPSTRRRTADTDDHDRSS